MSATAPPPTPLNSATICGIAVIFTWRAAGMPTAVPMATPRMISPQLPIPGISSVAMHRDRHADRRDAVAAHRRARAGQPHQPVDEEGEGDDVEQLDEVGAAHSSPSSICLARRRRLGLEHLEHAVGDQEAADDVDRAEGDRDDEQQLVEEAVDAEAEHEDAAEHDDAVDRVRARHQRRVQRVGHLGDRQEAGEAGQDEDRQVGQQHQACTASPSRTTHAPATTSSSKFRASVAVLAEQQLEQRLHVARVELAGVLGHASPAGSAARRS